MPYKLFFLGKGGNAGHIYLRYNEINGRIKMRTCGGPGAEHAKNGKGGRGKKNVASLLQNNIVFIL